MKQNRLNKFILVVTVLGSFITSNALAEDRALDMPEPGFSGFLMVGGGFSSGKTGLDDAAEDDDKTIGSLNESGKSRSEFMPIFDGALNYNFMETGTMVSINSENGWGMDISQFVGGLGMFSTGGHFGTEDVWADPYLTGTPRSKTDRDVLAFNFGWEQIMESDFSICYTLQTIDVDNDTAGKQDARLKRDGTIHNFNLSYLLFSNDAHALLTGLGYEIGNLDGSAQEYKGYELFLSHCYTGNEWDLTTSLSYGKKDFDKSHPKFNKTRDDNSYAVDTAYTLYNPFGFQDYFVTLFGGYEARDSNISFYDSSVFSSGLAVGLTF